MKTRFFRRVTAFSVALLVTLGRFTVLPKECLPQIGIVVSAAEINRDGSTRTNLGDELAAKKQCGENVFYELDDNGVLNITGSGKMYDFANQNDSPFYGAVNIYKVVISEGITNVGSRMFVQCKNLKNISLPNTINSIGDNAFYYCFSLTDINIPNNVTDIGSSAFWGCTALFNLIIPNNVIQLGSHMFYNCDNLYSVTLSNNLSKIEECTFYGCKSLNNITIPNSVTSIEKQAFYNCTSLKSVVLSQNLKSIGEAAFIGNTNLTSIELPATLKSIGGWAFDSCSSLTEITIPNNVTSIEQSAFRLCTSLTKAIVPANVTSIGTYAFIGDDLLSIYGYTGSAAESYAKENNIPFVALNGEISNNDYLQYLKFEFNNGAMIKFNYENGAFIPASKEIKYCYSAYLIDTEENKYGNDIILSNVTIKLIAPEGFSFDEFSSVMTYSEHFEQLRLNTDDCSGKITLYPQKYTNSKATLKAEVYVDDTLYYEFEKIVGIFLDNSSAIDVSEEYDKTDTDGDGLPDVWEMYGITYNGEFLDLPAMGADPNKPDIFVEVDWMKGFNPSEYEDSLYIVYKQFANHGINLHIDAGLDSIDYANAGKNWGDLSRANEINYVKNIYSGNASGDEIKGKWKKIIDNNFNENGARSLAFRYCIMGDNVILQSKILGEKTTGFSSGIPGQYFVVALGYIKNSNDVNSKKNGFKIAVAGTFMHELGHTLGLCHGGIDKNGNEDRKSNYKPNYLSIMNYSFQTDGLSFDNIHFSLAKSNDELIKYINYSEYALPALNEANLNEKEGIDPIGVTLDSKLKTKYYLPKQDGKDIVYVDMGDGMNCVALEPVDFNSDGEFSDSISADINKDKKITILADTTNDWKHIKYKGGAVGGNGASLDYLFEIFNTDELVFDIPEEAPADELFNVATDVTDEFPDTPTTSVPDESTTTTPNIPSGSTNVNPPTNTMTSTTFSVKVENKITNKTTKVKATRTDENVTINLGKDNDGYYANAYTSDEKLLDAVKIKSEKVKFTIPNDIDFYIIIDEVSHLDYEDVSSGAGIYDLLNETTTSLCVIVIIIIATVGSLSIVAIKRFSKNKH